MRDKHVGYAESISIIGWKYMAQERERSVDERAVLQAWGEVIRQYRQWKGMSRRELGQRAGLSPVFLGEIERGEKDASAHSLWLLAGALNASLAEMYLRVAVRLDRNAELVDETEQTALPLALSEPGAAYLTGVPRARDETAFELYELARLLRPDQQVALLVLARTLAPSGERDAAGDGNESNGTRSKKPSPRNNGPPT